MHITSIFLVSCIGPYLLFLTFYSFSYLLYIIIYIIIFIYYYFIYLFIIILFIIILFIIILFIICFSFTFLRLLSVVLSRTVQTALPVRLTRRTL